MAIILIVSSCEDTDIEKANADYDFNKIIPEVLGGISGPATATKTNTLEYMITYNRGGSTWAWSSTGAVVQTIDGSAGQKVNIFFDKSSTDFGADITISVAETTMGGLTSEAASMTVDVSPFLIDISGPTLVVATGNGSTSYSVPDNDGATYAWTATGGTVTGTGATVSVNWDMSATDITGTVSCVKTYLGLSSVQANYDVDLIGYLAKTRDDFIGTWTGNEFSHTGADLGLITVTIEAGTAADEIVIKAPAGIPGLFSSIFTGWGEVFQAGFGTDGDIVVKLDLTTNGFIEVEEAYWGQTLPGPWDYWVAGDGYWDGKDMTIHSAHDFLWGPGDRWRTYTVTLTKQ